MVDGGIIRDILSVNLYPGSFAWPNFVHHSILAFFCFYVRMMLQYTEVFIGVRYCLIYVSNLEMK